MRRFLPAAFLALLLPPAFFAADEKRPVTPAFDAWQLLNAPQDVDALDLRRRFGGAGLSLQAGMRSAAEVNAMIVTSGYPSFLFPVATVGKADAGLIAYASAESTATRRSESFAEAAKRILAGGVPTKRTPDETSRWLDAAAAAILEHVRAAEAAAGPNRDREFDLVAANLRIFAQLARFHAHRAIAAVHYSLFKRELRLAELYAATMSEREAVAAWRELVVAASDRYPANLCQHWQGELKNLEFGLKELEEQCCPPDATMLKEKVWQPAAGAPPARK